MGTLLRGGRFFVGDDPNIELILTPGHGNLPNNMSMLVRNVPRLGTVALVGDLIRSQNDVRPEVCSRVMVVMMMTTTAMMTS